MVRLTRSPFYWLLVVGLLALGSLTLSLSQPRNVAAQEQFGPVQPAALPSSQADGPAQTRLPNYDAFSSKAQAKEARADGAATAFENGHLVQMEPLLGVPTVLWTNEAVSAAARPGVPVRLRYSRSSIETAARQHLKRYATRYRLTEQDVNGAVISQVHDTGQGAIIVKFKQAFEGVEVFREQMAVVMSRQLDLAAFTGYVAGAADVKTAALRFALPSGKALAVALSDLSGVPVEATELQRDAAMMRARRDTPYEYFQATARLNAKAKPLQPVRIKKVLFHLVGELVPAYFLEAEIADPQNGPDSRYYAYVISAVDGELLYRKNLTANDSYSYRVWADPTSKFPADGPLQDFTPHPTGLLDNSAPPFASPYLVTLQNYPFSHNDPWLPGGATETVGNNVDAYADLVSPDGLTAGSDFRATTTAVNVFDRSYDLNQNPSVSQDQSMAAITQLFYVTNFLHDWFYDHGFDEASGNAQQDNFGRGGLGGDRLKAEAQDTNGVNLNNANMATPSDGSQPRMQMFLWSEAANSSLSLSGGSLSGNYAHQVAQFGPANFNITANLIVANDGSTDSPLGGPGTVDDACQALQGDYVGKIVVARRGACNFTVKVKNAQNAGALGALIFNNVASGLPGMGGTDPTVTIASLGISQADGNAILAQLSSGAATATMTGAAGPKRDGTIDNQIVAHEWGHYLHHRLAVTGTNQGGSLSEGWADFTAMLLTVHEGDNYDGVYGLGGYAAAGVVPNSHYFGLRRYPYSTDLTKNPLTFKHIQTGVALPVGPPTSSTHPNNAEVHNAGEIWASVLWECYAALLKDNTRSLTFKQRQDRMLSYVVAGLKLAPIDATYTESRDAILLAAYLGDPVDFQLFTQAFAKRGMGVKAVSPARNSNNHAGVVEDFTTGGNLAYVGAVLDDSVSNCDNDGVLDNQETGKLTLTLKNTGWTTLTNTTASITSMTPGVSFPNGTTINFPAASFSATTSSSVNVKLMGVSGFQTLSFGISFNDPGTGMGAMSTIYTVRANTDDLSNVSKTDDVESNHPVWTASHNAMLGNLADWGRFENSPFSHHWLGPDVSGISDHYLISPPLQVAPTGNFVMTFSHRFDFEADALTDWDGGVIELSTDDGANWVDVGSLIAGPDGYNGTITNPDALNPLLGRNVFSGQNSNYPNFQTVMLDLGTAYAGQTVRLRFRIGTDQAAGANGWEVDDISFAGIVNMPFAQVVAETTVSGGTLTPTSGTLFQGVLGQAFSQQFLLDNAVSNAITLANGSVLPPGLNLSSTGLLSGIPTAGGSFTFTLQAPNGCGNSANAVYTLQVVCPSFTLAPAALAPATAASAYNQTLTANPNVGGPHAFSVTGGALPTGLALSTLGVLSGTPTTPGTFNFTVTLTTFGGACTTTFPLSLTVLCPTIAMPASLPNGISGTAYNQSVAASPAGGNYTYAVTTNVLPPGLTLNPSTGALTGTPSAAGNYAFAITASGWNSAGGACTKTQSYNLLITGTCATISITTTSLPPATLGTAYPQQTLVATGGTAPYTFNVTTGALPPGLTLSSDGTFAGVPTMGGAFNFTVRATSQTGCAGQRTYIVSVTCAALVFAPASLPLGSKNVAYSQQLSVTPAHNPTFSLLVGSLPPGFTLSSAGLLSGTTSQAATYNFTVKAVVGTCQATKAYTLVIGASGSAALALSGDYDGDGQSDPGLWSAKDGVWRITRSSDGQTVAQRWGQAGDVSLLGDYDGDGQSDLAVFRPSDATFYIKRSSDGQALSKQWGLATDVPVPGDYDGDGQTDIAVWRGAEGAWYIVHSSDGMLETAFWGAGYAPYFDVPVAGDYDGDGKSDLAVFRRAAGTWFIKRSRDGQMLTKLWGLGTDVPVAADYDGDGATDIAVWRDSVWYLSLSANGSTRVVEWGSQAAPHYDQAQPGDYDGDGLADQAVWRASEGTWYLQCSRAGQQAKQVNGHAGERPIGVR